MGGSQEFEIAAPEFEISPPAPKLRPEDQAQIDKALRSVPLPKPDYMQTEQTLLHPIAEPPTPVSPEAEQYQRDLRQPKQRPSAADLAATAAEMFTVPSGGAASTEQGVGAGVKRHLTEVRTPGQRVTGAMGLASDISQTPVGVMGPAALEAGESLPAALKLGTGFLAGLGASKGAGKIAPKLGANEEQTQLAQDLAFWMPTVAASLSGFHGSAVDLPEAKGATVRVRGAGAGVAVTPESVNIGGRLGSFKGSVSIPRNGASAAPALEPPTIEGSLATDPSSQMLADHEVIQQRAARVVSGRPPVEPPPTPSAPPKAAEPAASRVTEISADDIQHIAGLIQKLPPQLRSQGLLEAHQTMSRILEQNGRVIGPNGRLVLIDSPKAAEKIAADWVNDEVSRQDELAAQAAKVQFTAVPSKPEAKPVARKSRRAQAAEIEQKAFEVAAPKLNFEIAPPEKAAEVAQPEQEFEIVPKPKPDEGVVESPAHGTEFGEKISPDELDSGAHSLFGAEHYADLPPEQQKAVVASLSKGSRGVSIATKEGRGELGLQIKPGEITTQKEQPALPVALSTETSRPAAQRENAPFQKGQQVRFSKDFPVRKGQNQEVAETIPRGTPAYIEHAGEGMNFVRLRLGDGRKLAVNQRAIEAAPSEASEKPQYASTQINLPEQHAKQVIETGKKLIPDEDLAGKGREGEPHVTLKYGVHENENALRRVLAEHKPFEATLGRIKTFPPTDNSEGTAPVVAEVNAPELKPLHEAIHKAIGAKEDDFEYKPHVTLAYVKPEAAMKYEGSTALEGTKIPVDRISLSRADRTQQAFPLGQKEEVEHAPLRGEVGTMKTSELKLAPNRFQYKLGTDAEGVSSLLKEQDKFNPDLAGVISVWRDPHDGKFYVVNGHHRFELAKRTGQKTIPVRHIAAPDAEQARSIGALQNIAEGRGTPVDAAKFFRDSRVSPEHLKDVGISLGEATARQGMALSRLDTPLFNKVVSGDLRLGRAVAIGEATDDPAEQKAILSLVDKKEARGQKISDGVLSELIRFVKESGREKETTADLFGSQEITKSLALEKAEISDYIRQQLSKDRKLFGFVAKEGRAEDLARAGNKIEVEKSKEFSTSAQQAEEIYNRLSSRGGEIADILDKAARRLADREDATAIKYDAYKRIREAVRRTLEGAAAERASGREGISGSSREPQETAPAADHINHTVEPTLPGMERVPAERAEANSEHQGEELTEKLQSPAQNIERTAGEIEQKSPLFRESAANPQDSLFEKRTNSEQAKVLPDAEGDRAVILESELKQLKQQRADVMAQMVAASPYGEKAMELRTKHNDFLRKIQEREDELSRLRGEPTRSEKRDLQTKEAEKPFGERPKEALKYDDAAQSQHWQVLERDYIDRRFKDKVRTYERAITESEQEMSAAKSGTKKHSEAAGAVEYRKKMLQRYTDKDALEAHRFKTEYNELIKKAVSQGKPVPQAVIDQKPEFKLAQDARERYEKGRHTSFANKSAAINDTMQKEEGFKVKRQDGKPITDDQIKEISSGVDDVVKVLGEPLRDTMRGTDLTIAHTSGKHPFLSDAGGMYHPVDRSVTAGIEDFLGMPVKALAHELGHWFDYESGRAIGVKSRIYTKDGKGHETQYKSESDSSSQIYELARRTMSDTREVARMLKVTKLSDLPDAERAEVERVKVVLGPYWKEPRELFARMFEQYIADELGKPSTAAENIEKYYKNPAWWDKEAWAKLKPLMAQEITKRFDALKERYSPKEATAPAPAISGPPEPSEVPGPGAKNVSAGKETKTSHLSDLTESVSKTASTKATVAERMRVGARIAESAGAAKDSLSHAYERVRGAMAAAWDILRRPPEWDDFTALTGRWSGARQESSWELQKFSDAIKQAIPDKLKREAITNWIEANGDTTLLHERAQTSKAPYRSGYEAALKLTDEEQTVARNIMNFHDAILEEAQKAGIVDEGVENYIQHIWDRTPEAARKVMAQINYAALRPNPAFAKQRKLPTYFDGEQLGFKPANKDVGFLTAAHDRAFQDAIASRAYIKSLFDGTAKDGRPLATISRASAHQIGEASDSAYLIRPHLKPAQEYADYRVVDHPALRKWRWAGNTEDGKQIFVQGDALIHPEIYQRVKNNLGTSAVRTWTISLAGHELHPGKAALAVSGELKQGILAFGGLFHQTTVGIHALEHKVAPFAPDDLDLHDPAQRGLVDHGLMVADFNAMESFGEGLISGGLVSKVPIAGPLQDAYQQYLFKSYIPRLKMAMAKAALERNRARYAGKLSDDQIQLLTANQANAAFGGLNYKMLGRNPTLQDVLRLAALAPDFLEARARFVGQGAKSYGREQLSALLLGAAVLYTIARVLNELLDGKAHWDRPFSLIYKDKEYSLRTVQGDIYRAATDLRGFLYARINPIARMGIEAATGRDEQGHPRELQAQLKDYLKENAPIPAQPFLRPSIDSNRQHFADALLRMGGVSEKKYLTGAEEEAAKIARGKGPMSYTPEESARYWAREKALKGMRKGDDTALEDARAKGLITSAEARELHKRVRHGELEDKVRDFTEAELRQVHDRAVADGEQETAEKLARMMRMKRRERLLRHLERFDSEEELVAK